MKLIKQILCLLLILFGFTTNAIATEIEAQVPMDIPLDYVDYEIESTRGTIVEIVDEKVEVFEALGDSKMTTQYIKVLITAGPRKGESVIVENIIDETYLYNIYVSKGQDIIIDIEVDLKGNVQKGYVIEIVRDKYLYYLIGFFVLVLVGIGGKKGFKTLLTLIFTIFCILKIFLPRALAGEDPIFLSIAIATIVTIATIFIVSGFNKKSVAAILGTVGGVLISGCIALVMGHVGHLTGLGNDEAQMLLVIPQATKFNFEGLLFSGIILGALGAVMDVCMSISSSMTEIQEANPELTCTKLFKSAMNVGKDMMGTMSNTLILAYTGSSMYMLLLFLAHKIPIVDILNKDFISSEIVRALAGSIGLILAIPVTALAFIVLTKRDEIKKTAIKKEELDNKELDNKELNNDEVNNKEEVEIDGL